MKGDGVVGQWICGRVGVVGGLWCWVIGEVGEGVYASDYVVVVGGAAAVDFSMEEARRMVAGGYDTVDLHFACGVAFSEDRANGVAIYEPCLESGDEVPGGRSVGVGYLSGVVAVVVMVVSVLRMYLEG